MADRAVLLAQITFYPRGPLAADGSTTIHHPGLGSSVKLEKSGLQSYALACLDQPQI